jgi:hypothetical protein
MATDYYYIALLYYSALKFSPTIYISRIYVFIYILAHGKLLCVAACVSNGTLSLVSKLCSDNLPALCYSNQNDGDKTSKFSHQA